MRAKELEVQGSLRGGMNSGPKIEFLGVASTGVLFKQRLEVLILIDSGGGGKTGT